MTSPRLTQKKVVVFGASGGLGSRLWQYAYHEGAELTLFTRSKDALGEVPATVRVVEGDALDQLVPRGRALQVLHKICLQLAPARAQPGPGRRGLDRTYADGIGPSRTG